MLGDSQITLCQFLQRSHGVLSVIDRLNRVRVQLFRRLAPIDPVTLNDLRHVRLQQFVQPGRSGPFFKRAVQSSARPLDEMQNGARPGFDNVFHHYLADRVHHHDRDARDLPALCKESLKGVQPNTRPLCITAKSLRERDTSSVA
jgi:hypothetical protein